MAFSVSELAKRCDARVQGDGAKIISSVATLEQAGPKDLAYVADAKYRDRMAQTAAGALVLSQADATVYKGTALIAENPRLCFARAAALFESQIDRTGIHPNASIHPDARIGPGVSIGPYAVVEAGAVLGENVVIGASSYIGPDAEIGSHSRLAPHVIVNRRCRIGSRCLIHSGAVIGADGFGFVKDGEAWVKVPQLGRVLIGDDVEIGANTTIDRGALGDTVIGQGVRLDNLIQIAHNVQIGDHTAIAACTGIAGSTVIGKRCAIGGAAKIGGHLHITDDVQVLGNALVTAPITEPGSYSSALPVEPAAQWRRNAVRFRQLDEIARRLRKLEQAIERIVSGEKN